MSGARFAIFLTVAAWLSYLVEQAMRLHRSDLSARTLLEALVYLLVVSMLTSSALAYLWARLGHLNRAGAHRRVSRSTIDDVFDDALPTLTVIVPSYREDARVVRQTLLSAALQEYPDLSVVLLIDDPTNPSNPEHIEVLEAARALPGQIEDYLAEQRRRCQGALEAFENAKPEPEVSAATLTTLAGHYEDTAAWFAAEAEAVVIVDHSDEFVATEIFGRLEADLRSVATALRAAAADPTAAISSRRVHQLYRRLVWTFRAQLSSFERKSFASLSHEANKAMNLNSYLGLMGGCYTIQSGAGGRVLIPSRGNRHDLCVANPDYVLTLDADSTLLPEYCLRLVHFMEQPENADVGVVQTPYSAYRGAGSRIERIAGATTDIQHIVHQGLTRYNATFWVGANAILRKSALDDIRVEEEEAGFRIRRYIQDRTVIEDTESSIDLRAKGWRLHNYPERLSYSATPPDFGSLVVQRQRWANGGLVILPKMRKLWHGRKSPDRPSFAELFLRTNYLASITWASLGLVVLLGYPFDDRLLSRFAVVTALPYFVAMANDLRRCGYKRTDMLRLYGFNLLLLPVNLSGTMKSLVQAIGGQKIAFARTPKIRNRTVAPLLFVLLPYVLLAWSAYTLARDIQQQFYIHAVFAAVNSALTGYAILAFVGLRNSIIDLFMNLRELIYDPATVREAQDTPPDWVTVLYHGNVLDGEAEQTAPLALALAANDQASQSVARIDDVPVARIDDVPVARFEVPLDLDADLDADAAGDRSQDAAADLLARCVEILSKSGDVLVRQQGSSLEVRVIATVDSPAETPATEVNPR